MIVAAQVQQAVQDQLCHLSLEIQPVPGGLRGGTFHRDHDITETDIGEFLKLSPIRRK